MTLFIKKWKFQIFQNNREWTVVLIFFKLNVRDNTWKQWVVLIILIIFIILIFCVLMHIIYILILKSQIKFSTIVNRKQFFRS